MNPFRSLFLSISRMPPVIMTLVIIGLAATVTTIVMGYLNDVQKRADETASNYERLKNEKTTVVYATKDLDEGEIIPQEALEEKEVEKSKAPVDSFQSSAGVIGAVAAYTIPAGTIVSQHSLKARGVSTSFQGKIKNGMRALTFGVDTNSGVNGFIAPGNHIDVIAVTGSGGETHAAPVMSDVEVIAVGTTYQKQPGSSSANPAGSVTVLVPPEDSQKLIKAIVSSKLYLTLRNDGDHTPIAVVDISSMYPRKTVSPDLTAFMPLPEPPPVRSSAEPHKTEVPVAQAPAPVHEVDLWAGSKKDVLTLPTR